MLPSLTASAAARLRARRAERAQRNQLRAELASYRTPAERGSAATRRRFAYRRQVPHGRSTARPRGRRAGRHRRSAALGWQRRAGRVPRADRGFRLRRSCEVAR